VLPQAQVLYTQALVEVEEVEHTQVQVRVYHTRQVMVDNIFLESAEEVEAQEA